MAKRSKQCVPSKKAAPPKALTIPAENGHVTQSPLQRMLYIHDLLQTEKYPNSNYLCEKLECHTSTIRRDIEFMRNVLGLPVGYDERRYGFYYTEKVKQFPTVKLTSGELVALCVAQHLMGSHRGAPFEPHLRSAFEKITHSMQDEITLRWNELASAFSVRTNGCEVAINTEAALRLTSAMEECEEVTFAYAKLQGKGREQRRVEPLHITSLDDSWYLLANDLARKEHRTFALSRMSEVNGTGRRFEKPKDFDPEKLLENSIGIYKGEKPERVRLHARGIAARLIAERRWHSSQKLKDVPETDGEEVEVTMKVAITPELERWIFSWAAEVQVLEPESLREKIRATARAMAKGK